MSADPVAIVIEAMADQLTEMQKEFETLRSDDNAARSRLETKLDMLVADVGALRESVSNMPAPTVQMPQRNRKSGSQVVGITVTERDENGMGKNFEVSLRALQ